MFLHCRSKEERKAHVAALKRLGELYGAAVKRQQQHNHRNAAPSLTDIEEMLLKSQDYAQQKSAAARDEHSEDEQQRAQAHTTQPQPQWSPPEPDPVTTEIDRSLPREGVSAPPASNPDFAGID